MTTPSGVVFSNTTPQANADRPTKALPTERVQFVRQLNLLRSFAAVSGQANKDAKVGDVANVAKLNPSTVSLCNGFFVDVGFLERFANGGFIPSAEVHAFHRAYNWKPETAGYKLAPRLRGTWFFKRLLPKLNMGAISEADAIHDLADAASAGKKYEAQLAMLLEYLEVAGLIRRDGGMVREGPNAHGDSDDAPTVAASPSPAAPHAPASTGTTHHVNETRSAPPTSGQGVRFSIDIDVDMAEISTWSADRITAFFAGIAKVLAAKQGAENLNP